MSKKNGFTHMSKEEHIVVARKGGLAISQNREHMAEIGRKGGKAKRKKKEEDKPNTIL